MYSKSFVYREKFIKKTYPTRTEYIVLSSSRSAGFEEISKKEERGKGKADKIEIERISTSRIKRKIKDFAECNNFEFFFTQTLKAERYNLDNFKENIQKKFKAYKRKNKNFIYLIIYEKHKDGAFHLHGLVAGLGVDVYTNNNGFLSLKFFEDLGFNSLSKIKDKIKISNYITKYITKDFEKTSSGYSYFHSKGLSLPSSEIIQKLPNNLRIVFENDYLKKMESVSND